MFAREAVSHVKRLHEFSPCVRVSNDNGVSARRGACKPAPVPAGIVAIAAEIAGGIALRYVADGVFRISRSEGVSA